MKNKKIFSDLDYETYDNIVRDKVEELKFNFKVPYTHIAKNLRVDYVTFMNWLRGRRRLTGEELNHYCDTLDVMLSEYDLIKVFFKEDSKK